MSILYFDEIPDVETYHELRMAVDWCVFCREQSETAIINRLVELINGANVEPRKKEIIEFCEEI